MKPALYVIGRVGPWLVVRTATWIIGLTVVWIAWPRPLYGQSVWPIYPNNSAISVTSSGDIGIGTGSPEARLHVEGWTTFHFDDWGNDTVVFRGQKSTGSKWGEYAIRTS